MNVTFSSTAALTEATRRALAKAQSQLIDAHKELSSGRHADVGRTLGAATSTTITLRQQTDRLQSITDTNKLVSTRLGLTQTTLTSVGESAQAFISSLLAVRGNPNGGEGIAKAAAQDALRSFTTLINTNFAGEYIFAGINVDTQPVTDYFSSPAPASKAAVDAAFMTAFGVPQGDPALQAVSVADMQAFLDGPFAALFDPSGWSATWSGASDQNVRSRISPQELIETSTSANAEPFRKLASAYAMVADLGIDDLSDQAYTAVIDNAIRLVGDAVSGINAEQSKLGLAQERVSKSTERMSIEMDILVKQVSALEQVNAEDAAVRITSLMTQIETSYSLTARIQNLSILNYL